MRFIHGCAPKIIAHRNMIYPSIITNITLRLACITSVINNNMLLFVLLMRLPNPPTPLREPRWHWYVCCDSGE
jgi:hypothetical protein